MSRRSKIDKPVASDNVLERQSQSAEEIYAIRSSGQNLLPSNPSFAAFSSDQVQEKNKPLQETPPIRSSFDPALYFRELTYRLPKSMPVSPSPGEIAHQIPSIADVLADHLLKMLGIDLEYLSTHPLVNRQKYFRSVMFRIPSEQLAMLMKHANEAANFAGAVGKSVVKDAFDRRLDQILNLKPHFTHLSYESIQVHNQQAEKFTTKKRLPIVLRLPQSIYDQTMVEPDQKIFIKDNIRYRPLQVAAQLAQTPRQTLLNWVKNKTEFAGRPIQSYYLAPVDRYFVSEESIQRIANRFVKWPSQEPAGTVILGETKDKTGFLTMSEAARIVGVSSRTMWLWTSRGKAPTSKALDVVKCTTSDHFYIRQKDALDLKRLVPKSGLQRGRRSQTTPQP